VRLGSVHNVVLGELISRRGYGYGYELSDQLSELTAALGYSDTVVYAALVSLERQGLVRVIERETPRTAKRQARARVYHEATEKGHRQFREWMASMPRKAPLREELHMQLIEATAEDLPHMIEALGDFERQCREQLSALIGRPLRIGAGKRPAPGASLVHDGLVAHLQTMMEWAQRSRASLVNLVEHPSGVPGRRRP
jgi:DNA-binding PadR family transcriptional regulator